MKDTMKLYSSFKDMQTLLDRKDIVINTVLNAIKRENQHNDYTLEYKDSQILSKEDNTFLLEVILNKIYN